ncbi:MAG: DNA ligase [Planctomycetes bacterium]|nr:DNA ligase [Planctomycetota bacterium]
MATAQRLPERIAPMLAVSGPPFDAESHVFEPKWDGIRALVFCDAPDLPLRVHGRRRTDLAGRYPELADLRGLPEGTVLDGELVVLDAAGRPDFPAAVRRENTAVRHAAAAAVSAPVVYVAFDLLYCGHQSWLARPFAERRTQLGAVVQALGSARCFATSGVVGSGTALFEATRAQGLEGVVGKRLDAPYCPGERSASWIKSKAPQRVHCLILGYEPAGERDLKSLVVAADLDGELRCVGKVGSGFSAAERAALVARLAARPAAVPLVPNEWRARWVTPGLYCTVEFLERTAHGNLRAPVFVGMVADGEVA